MGGNEAEIFIIAISGWKKKLLVDYIFNTSYFLVGLYIGTVS